jgi:hypothetical protein
MELISSRLLRGKNHSSLGGRKAYLNFELKDHDRRRRRRFAPSLTSKFRYARVSRAMNGNCDPGGRKGISLFARSESETMLNLSGAFRGESNTNFPRHPTSIQLADVCGFVRFSASTGQKCFT